jgi:hypothetical protein
MARPASLLLSSSLACAALVAPMVARAQSRSPRIVVAAFNGERAAVTRSLVARVLANHVGEIELVSQGEYAAAAGRVGAGDRLDEATAMALARELRVDAMVVGTMERQNNLWHLRLRVLRARDGRSAASATWEFERPEELNALGNEMWEQLHGAFQVDPTVSQTPAAPRGGDGEVPVERTPREEVAAPAAGAPPEAPTPGLGWLWMQLGGGLAGRVWRIPLLGETTPRGYENTAFGEIRAAAAAYYRLNNNRLGVGVEAALGIPLGLSSQGRSATGRTVAISTSAVELHFGASLAVRPTNGGMMRAFVGMVYHQFSVDTASLSPEMRLAPVTYVGLRVAGEGTLPVVARRDFEFGVIFGGELRFVALGSEVKEAFGVNPGATLGFGSWFGLSFRADRAAPGLGFRLTAEFMRYATDFAGPARVGPAAESVDDYTRFLLSVVYALGTDRAPRPSPADAYVDPNAPAGTPPDGEQSGTRPAGDPFGSR